MLIILLAMLYGYFRGFIREFFSIFSIFISGYLSIHFYPNISLFIKKFVVMGVVADVISLSILFFFIYSCFGIVIKFTAKKVSNTSFVIFDKNFGILFGFIKIIIIFSVLNIILLLTIWKSKYPSWVQEAKFFNVIRYTSNIIIKTIPSNTLSSISKIFKINIKLLKDKNSLQAEQYGEPKLDNDDYKKKEGYSDNDNESLDKLFNIENND